MSNYSTILLATDLGPHNESLFAHGVKLALGLRAHLHVVHVHKAGEAPHWDAMPTVRQLLTRWGVLQPDADIDTFNALGITISLTSVAGNTPATEVALVASRIKPDLMILGTEARQGLKQYFRTSVAEVIAASTPVPTLFLSDKSVGFVDVQTGELHLGHVMVPIGGKMPHQTTVDTALSLLDALDPGATEITFLHAGTNQDDLPVFDLPPRLDRYWKTVFQPGRIVPAILKAVGELNPNMLIMSTHGHRRWVDDLIGSKTERVMRELSVPVVAVPVIEDAT